MCHAIANIATVDEANNDTIQKYKKDNALIEEMLHQIEIELNGRTEL